MSSYFQTVYNLIIRVSLSRSSVIRSFIEVNRSLELRFFWAKVEILQSVKSWRRESFWRREMYYSTGKAVVGRDKRCKAFDFLLFWIIVVKWEWFLGSINSFSINLVKFYFIFFVDRIFSFNLTYMVDSISFLDAFLTNCWRELHTNFLWRLLRIKFFIVFFANLFFNNFFISTKAFYLREFPPNLRNTYPILLCWIF